MIFSLRVRNIDATIHETKKYVKILVYFLEQKNDEMILTCVIKEIYLINNFKAHLLIENDFLESKDFTIDINNRKISIVNCDVITELSIEQCDLYVKRNIHAI